MSSTIMQPQIEQLAERPDLLPIVAAWIYNQWWTTVEGASVNTLANQLREHLVHDEIPLTFVASLDHSPIGTATLMAHDVGTEQWPDLSPWLAALYVMPDYRRRGVGGALANAIVSKATALGVGVLYLSTIDRERFYAHLGWQVIDRHHGLVVMSKSTESQP